MTWFSRSQSENIHMFVYIYRRYLINALLLYIEFMCVLLWAAAQRKRATMLYFANVLFIYLFIFFYGRLILRPWLTEVRENFTRGRP